MNLYKDIYIHVLAWEVALQLTPKTCFNTPPRHTIQVGLSFVQVASRPGINPPSFPRISLSVVNAPSIVTFLSSHSRVAAPARCVALASPSCSPHPLRASACLRARPCTRRSPMHPSCTVTRLAPVRVHAQGPYILLQLKSLSTSTTYHPVVIHQDHHYP